MTPEPRTPGDDRSAPPGGAPVDGLMPEPLDPETFATLGALLHARAGIRLAPCKLPMAQARLNRRLRHLGLRSFPEYLARLQADSDGEEWTHFVNALTTNLTRFFREEHHFHRLVAWLATLRPLPRPVRVWSAGCSTGEEPYSLAMVLRSEFPGASIRILATDIDSAVLQEARTGVYDQNRVKDLSQEWLRFAFQRGKGEWAGKVRVRDEIRSMIEFRSLNLLGSSWPPPGTFEAIFCRNVMIYFDKAAQNEVIRRFHRTLAPGGLLMVGHSESLLDPTLGFESQGNTVFLRRDP